MVRITVGAVGNLKYAMTPKLRKALTDAGLWGKHPFDSSVMDVSYSSKIAEVVQKLFKAGKLKPKDVLVLYTAFACTKNP